jgi:hypothetical protein
MNSAIIEYIVPVLNQINDAEKLMIVLITGLNSRVEL